MIRSAASKAMWVGRTTAAVVGLGIALAPVLGVATMALAAVPGDPFKLGKVNSIDKASMLVGSVTGPLLKVDNSGGGPALKLEANPGKAPVVVNADAGKATNLDADKLDGKEASDFYAQGSKVADSIHADQADSATSAGDANTLDGKDSTEFLGKTEKAADSDTLDGRDSTQFVKGFSGTVSVDPPSVAPNSCATSSVTVTGVTAGNVVFLTPTLNFTFSNSLTLMTHREVNNNDKIFYTVCNVGNSSVDALAGSWGFLVARQF